jgi:hypothetical protein
MQDNFLVEVGIPEETLAPVDNREESRSAYGYLRRTLRHRASDVVEH